MVKSRKEYTSLFVGKNLCICEENWCTHSLYIRSLETLGRFRDKRIVSIVRLVYYMLIDNYMYKNV